MLSFLFAAIILTPGAAFARSCTLEEATAAEDAAASLENWAQVFAAFERFGHCDDGAIAEGFTESVVGLLASHWPTLPRIPALEKRNPAFRGFVLRHINTTADSADLKRIAGLARHECPEPYGSLCAAIAKAAAAR